MELRHIESFEKVCQYKSFSKAAATLFISQPAITAHINALEQELGASLFNRNSKPLNLTEAGEIMLKYSKDILMMSQRAISEIKSYGQGLSGNLHICASESTTEWLTSYLNQYKLRFPGAEIQLSIYLSTVTIPKVLAQEADIGIVRHSSRTFHQPMLHEIEIAEDRGILVFSPRHRFASFDVIPKRVLSGQNVNVPIIIFGKQTDFGQQVMTILSREGINYDDNMNFSNAEAIKLFLRKSNHVAFMPEALVHSEVESGTLVSRPIEDFPPIQRFSFLIYREDSTQSPLLTQFIKDLLCSLGKSEALTTCCQLRTSNAVPPLVPG